MAEIKVSYVHQVVGTIKMLHQLTNRLTQQVGLSMDQFLLLDYLASHQYATGNELATQLQIANSTVSHQLGSLLRKQLVEQHNNPADRRIRYTVITIQGQRTYHDALKALQTTDPNTQFELLGAVAERLAPLTARYYGG